MEQTVKPLIFVEFRQRVQVISIDLYHMMFGRMLNNKDLKL